MNRATILDAMIIVVAAAIPMSLYGNQLIMDIGITFQVNPLSEFLRETQAWTQTGLGRPTGLDLGFLFPIASYFGAMQIAGIPSALAEKIWVTAFLFLSGLSMYLLSSIVLERIARTARVLSAFFYMSSPYVLQALTGSSVPLLSYAVFPLIVALSIKGLRSEQPFRYGAMVALSTLVISFPQPVFNVIVMISVVILALYLRCMKLTSNRRIWRFGLSSLLLTLGLSAWFLIPAFLFLLNSAGPTIAALQSYEGTRPFSPYENVLSVLREVSDPGLYYGLFPYMQYYIDNLFSLVSAMAIVSLSAVSYLFVKDRGWSLYKNLFAILLVIAVFMAAGPNQPGTGALFGWLYSHFPGFWIFQDGFDWLFVLCLVYALSLTALLNMALKSNIRFGRVAKPLSLLFVVSLTVGNSLPLYQAQIFQTGDMFPSIPSYWNQAAQWINSQAGNFKILLLPGVFPVYTWGTTRDAVTSAIIRNPTIYYGFEMSPDQVPIYNAIFASVSQKANYLAPELATLGVKYIIVQGDLSNFRNVTGLNQWLNGLPGISHREDFGPLSIYEDSEYEGRIFEPGSNFLLLSNGSIASSSQRNLTITSFPALYDNGIPNEAAPSSWHSTRGQANLTETDGPLDGSSSILVNGTTDSAGLLEVSYSNLLSINRTGTLEVWFKSSIQLPATDFQIRFTDLDHRHEIFQYPFDAPVSSWIEWTLDLSKPTSTDNAAFDGSHGATLAITVAAGAGLQTSVAFGGINLVNSSPAYKASALSFDQQSATGLVVHMNATAPYVLVFSDSYSPQWNAYIDGQRIASHYESANNTNAWFVNLTGSYDVNFVFGGENIVLFHYPSGSPLDYEQQSATGLVVHMNATAPYVLVFSDSYSPQWNAYIDGQRIASHYEINGYANGWSINQLGQYDITITYSNQQWYVYGELVTAFTLLVTFLVLVMSRHSKIHPRLKALVEHSEET